MESIEIWQAPSRHYS